jgi:digeranylgeranylglycerophospholipid reductase
MHRMRQLQEILPGVGTAPPCREKSEMNYDALVAGASVSGLYTGYRLAQAGWKVRILDRRKEIGVPVRCGEATGNRAELARFFPIDESWIAGDVMGLAVHVNSQYTMHRKIPQTGVMLHRDKFEKYLADLAQNAGAEISLSTNVKGLKNKNGAYSMVLDDDSDLSSHICIGADGVESKIGQWAGITRSLSLDDSFPSAQYHLKTDFCRDGFLHFFVGSKIIPNGYLWIFTRPEGHISAGAGLYGCREPGSKALEYLDNFINTNLGAVTREQFITGCVPLAICPRILHRNNCAVVGDAARQANPLTAGGIMNSLEAADLLVIQLLKQERSPASPRLLSSYSRIWRTKPRMEQKSFYLIQKLFLSWNDKELLWVIKTAEKLFSYSIDRSRPFSLPLVPFIKLLMYFVPRAIRHINLLFR